jgi:hypothetical protein
VNIQIESQMFYGDEQALRSFFFVHYLVHKQVDSVIASRSLGSNANATIDSSRALDGLVQAMLKPPQRDEGAARALSDWLQLHADLHQAEYAALQLGLAPDLGVVRFEDESAFYDWMFAHAAVHDTLGAATGIL